MSDSAVAMGDSSSTFTATDLLSLTIHPLLLTISVPFFYLSTLLLLISHVTFPVQLALVHSQKNVHALHFHD
jgi:hypothetical protein